MLRRDMTKDEILNFLRDKRAFLAERYGVLSIGLFGSYARDEARDSSDIDIAVEIVGILSMSKSQKSMSIDSLFKI